MPWGISFEELFKTVRSVSWVFGTIISVSLTLIIARIFLETQSYLIVLELLFGIILVTLLIILLLIREELNQTYAKNREELKKVTFDNEKFASSVIDDLGRIPNEITQTALRKIVKFDEETFDQFQKVQTKSYDEVKDSPNEIPTVYSETTRILKNEMIYENYGDFRVELSSSSYVPNLDDISVEVADEKISLTKENSDPKLFISYELADKEKKPKRSILQFTIPFLIEPQQAKALKWYYRTKAYDKALWNKNDWVTLRCNRPTNEIYFEIALTGKMKEHYELAVSTARDKLRKGFKRIEITDDSNQRILPYETEIWKKHCPDWKTQRITWQINNPKIGYDYSLFFTIINKEREKNH